MNNLPIEQFHEPDTGAVEKPRWRGVIHTWAAPASLVSGAWMISRATNRQAVIAAAIFAGTLTLLYAVSASYHRVHWKTLQARQWARRADHACIYALIAGSYTPICLVGLPGATGIHLLWLVWGVAVAGAAKTLFWVRAPKAFSAALYVGMGWLIAPHFSTIGNTLPHAVLTLLVAGGAAYTIGALCYALKRPAGTPGVWGYHEVFHALTVVGAGCHTVAVAQLLGA